MDKTYHSRRYGNKACRTNELMRIGLVISGAMFFFGIPESVVAQLSETIQKGQALSNIPVKRDYPNQDGWSRTEKTDMLSGVSSLRFALRGKFLQAPRQDAPGEPYLVVDCDPTKSSIRGRVHGRVLDAYVDAGAVMNSEVYVSRGLVTTTVHKVVSVQYRRDDERKIQSQDWERSTDFSSLYLSFHAGLIGDAGELHLSELLYSHAGLHNENSSPQVQKVVISVPEYLGAAIVMEFDFPDSAAVADSCGLIIHKTKK
jgi:hypothetical protein